MNQPNVTVCDALMGAGKTTLAIRMMDDIATSFENVFEDGAHRFIYITPFLDEVARVKETLAKHSGQQIAFDPKPKEGKKLQHLNEMILEGRNIVATHALFSYVNEDTYAALEEFQYTLLIDEVADWVERYPISATDLKVLYDQRILSTDPATRRMIWTDPEGGYRGRFEDLRSLCLQGKAVASRFGVNGVPTVLLWQFPVEMLTKFKEVYIFTHLFLGSDMAAYLRLHGVPVRMATIGLDGSLVDYDDSIEWTRLERVMPLIHVVDDKDLNAIGTRSGRSNPLSVSWFTTDLKKHGGKKVAQLKRNAYTFFRRHAEAKSSECLWSTYKNFKGRVKGEGFARSFAPCNARSTNQYRGRKALAYLVNLFHHPYIRAYFEDAGAPVSEDLYALLTMTQWVWRSQIRDGKPIDVYIPSDRMRTLFLEWLEGRLPLSPVNPRLVATQPDNTETEEAAESLAKAEDQAEVDDEAEAELARYA